MPGLREEEVQAMIHVTEALIEYDHQEIVIERKAAAIVQPDRSVHRPDGPPLTLMAQELFLSGTTADAVRVVTVNGEKIETDMVLIGMPDADFTEDDEFECWGRRFRVIDVHPEQRWERKGWVVEVGRGR